MCKSKKEKEYEEKHYVFLLPFDFIYEDAKEYLENDITRISRKRNMFYINTTEKEVRRNEFLRMFCENLYNVHSKGERLITKVTIREYIL